MRYHTGNNLPEEFINHMDDFNLLCDITLGILSIKPLKAGYINHYLYEILPKVKLQYLIEEEDIVQELACIWIKAIDQYRKNRPVCTLKRYLLRIGVWGLRDFLIQESHIVMVEPFPTQDLFPTEEMPSFDLGLTFLFNGSTHPLLKDLNEYERYIIYMRFTEDKHVKLIAKYIQKDRLTTTKYVNKIYKKMRSSYAKNTNGYC